MLTARQTAIFDFILEFRRNHGCSPSIPEIQKAFLIRSPNGVVGHLLSLEAKGYVRRSNRGSRQIDVVEDRAARGRGAIYCLPVHGYAGAESVTRPKDFVTIDERTLGFAPAQGTFGLRASDGSMKRAGIEPGDLVIFEPSDQPGSGAIIAEQTGGKFVLRRIAKSPKQQKHAEAPQSVARLVIRKLD